MDAASGRPNRSLEEHLFANGYEFSFFQAVRLLARLLPGRTVVGGGTSPRLDVVHFRARLSSAFPASAIHELKREAEGGTSMTVAFLGLTGPLGILPSFYTEYLISCGFKKDKATAAFFDIFNHRIISLFYRAWEKHSFAVSYERDHRTYPTTPAGITQYLFDLVGLGTSGLRNRLQMADESLLLYAGLIAQRPHSASALAGILRDYFRVPIEIKQFCGRWVSLEADTLSYLHIAGKHNQLGLGAVAGDAVWNPQAGFRIRMGPLGFKRFAAFAHKTNAFSQLTKLVRFFVGPILEFDLQLVLQAAEVPRCRATDEGDFAPRLGVSSWLERFDTPNGDLSGREPVVVEAMEESNQSEQKSFKHDADDAIMAPDRRIAA